MNGDLVAPRRGEQVEKRLAAVAKVRVAEKAFRVAGRDFGRGAILVKREENGEGIGKTLEAIAKDRGVAILGVATAKAERGPDLGGNYFHPLIAPLVYAVPVQLLAYHTACVKGTDVDQPRNLAKSVTVE